MTQERLMVIAPHPDDEVLAAGGLILRTLESGGSVKVLAVTDGENNPWSQRLAERRWRIRSVDRVRFGRVRRDEMMAALRVIGVGERDVRFLHLPDQGLTDLLVNRTPGPVAALAAEIQEARPTLLVAPSLGDRHPDHSAIAVMVREAIESLGEDIELPRSMSYVVHGPRPGQTGRDGMRVHLSQTERERKSRAVRCHATQVATHPFTYRRVAWQDEVFCSVLDDGAMAGAHPVVRTHLEDSALRLEVASHPRPGAFGPRLLRLVAIGPEPASLAIDLSSRSGQAPIVDTVSGKVITCARVAGGRRRTVVKIPREVFPMGGRCFAKVERRFGFFDEAGWAEVSTPRDVNPHPRREPVMTPRTEEICCVIPCYNVVAFCGEVVRAAAGQAARVIAVDDGSTDGTSEVLRSAAEGDKRVTVLSLPTNQGKGVALLTAFHHALEMTSFDVLVTLDGDGQHRASDIPAIAAACRGGADFVIGDRFAVNGHHETPLRSLAGNNFCGAVIRTLFADCPRDTQCGMRALSRPFLQEILPLVRGRRYDVELDILLHALERKRRIETVPIPAIYIEGNSSSHYRPIADSFSIAWQVIRHLPSAWRTSRDDSAR